jgi:hypothetical protein
MTVFYVFFDEHGSSETFGEKAEAKGTVEAGELKTASYVKVNATNAQRAAEAVKEAFGQGVETLKSLVGSEANVEEKTA